MRVVDASGSWRHEWMAGFWRITCRAFGYESSQILNLTSLFQREHDCCTPASTVPRPFRATISAPASLESDQILTSSRPPVAPPVFVFPHSASQIFWPLKATTRPTATTLPSPTPPPQWRLPHSLQRRQEAVRIQRVQTRAQTGKCCRARALCTLHALSTSY
jgi:hypothetical protein